MEHRTLVINIFITTKYTNVLRIYKIKNKIKQFKNNEMFFKLAKIYNPFKYKSTVIKLK